MDKYNHMPDRIDFANFGPSYGMNCFHYEVIEAMSKNGFNFSLSMQDLYHDYALYKTYEESFDDGAIVAITLSYFSFCSDTEAPTGNRYYKILDRAYIKDYTIEKEVSTRFFPIYGQGGSLVRDLTNDLLNRIMKKSVTTSDRETVVTTELAAEEEELKADSKTCIISIENGNLKVFGDQIDINETILVNWIKEMKEKGLRPILVLTPYWHDYAYGFDEALLKASYYDPVSNVIQKTGVDYIDFCGAEYDEFIHTPRYFNNCDHVSMEGSVEFMSLYVKCLEERGFLEAD